MTGDVSKKALAMDMEDISWMEIGDTILASNYAASSKQAPPEQHILASDTLMMKVQQAYDAVNNSCNGLRQSAMTLRGKIDPIVVQAALEQADLAAELLKELQAILLADRDALFEKPVTTMMKEIANKYQTVRMKDVEMKALEKGLNPKKKIANSAFTE